MALTALFKKGIISAAAAAGLMAFVPPVYAENDKSRADEDLYIIGVGRSEDSDKLVFAGCDTPENYARYSKALHDNASDNVLTELRSEGKCIVLSNRDHIFYHIKIKSMDKQTGRVTEVVRDFGGITDGPFFTDVVPDKKLVKNVRHSEKIEQRIKEMLDLFTKRWVGKVFVTEYNPCVFTSLPEYKEYLYESGKTKESIRVGMDFRRSGRCLVLKRGTLVQVVSSDVDNNTEYKILSGEYKGRTVYQNREIVSGKPMVFSE